ncbi:hypothetical protein Y032_0011g1327 [Ancylostoma ceylanicum]|uniref:Uncharacterized protein n=1 Tax=Ancylostoma ceylanicum TaxID=53326 RepID=A0A016VF70_9BILA|nr:hypothetical protein Y032_0011g1327 [Ancylostoma ceylanicum]
MTHRLKSVPNNKKDRPSRRSPVPSTSASGPSFEQAIDLLINDDQVPAHLKTIVRHVVEKLSGMELLIKKNSELENRLKEEMAEQKRLKSEIESLKRALSSNKDRPGKRSPLPPTSAREPSLDQAIHLLAKDDQIPPHLKAIVKHLAEKLSSMELLTKKNFELEDRLKEETAENKRLKDEVESLKQAMSGSEEGPVGLHWHGNLIQLLLAMTHRSRSVPAHKKKYSSDVTSETHKTPRNPRRFKKSTLDNRPEWNNGESPDQ